MDRRTQRHHLKFGIPLIRKPLSTLTLLIIGVLTSLHISSPSRFAGYSAAAEEQALNGGNARLLTPGQSVIENLGGGSRIYEIYLAKDQYLRVLVYKTDFDLSVTFSGPDDQQRLNFV